MTNREIIQEALTLSGKMENSENFKSYGVWKAEGYQVKKGEKAVLQLNLWIPVKYKVKEETNSEVDGEKRNGFKMKKTSLFHISQVEKIKE